MSYPAGFDARGLAPRILIKDTKGVVKFTWEHALIDASPIQDFALVDWQIQGGVNTFHGIGSILIDDRNQALLDNTDLARPIKIKNGWRMIMELGKNEAGLETWFDGLIEEPEMIEEQGTITKIQINAIGFGIRTAHRKTRIRRFQKKTSDGLSLDNTDVDVKISELFKDILTQDDHFAHSGLPLESELGIPNLVSYHTFEGDVLDKKGTNNGTLVGTATFVNGKIGKAASFGSGKIDRVTLTDTPYDVERTDKFSISVWINPDDTAAEGMLFTKGSLATLGRWAFFKEIDEKISMILVGSNSTSLFMRTVNAVSTTKLTHVAMTYDGSSTAAGLKIYFDDVLQSLTTVNANLNTSILNNDVAAIGAFQNGDLPYEGLIDDARFYNKELTAEEVKDLFNVPFKTDQVDDINIKLPDLQRDFQSFGLVLNELANIGGALYGITPTMDAYLRLRGVTPSGFLITNKLTDLKTTGWPSAKLLISRQQRFNYKESTIDSGYTIIHGTGAQHDVLDADQIRRS